MEKNENFPEMIAEQGDFAKLIIKLKVEKEKRKLQTSVVVVYNPF